MPFTDAHLQALGRITVNFSTLEFTLIAMLSGLVEPQDHGVGQIVGAHLSFARLLTVVGALYRRRRPAEAADLERLDALLARAAAAEERRNTAIHSAYVVAEGAPTDIVTRLKITAKREKGLSHTVQDVTPAYFGEIADELHGVTVDLLRFVGDRIVLSAPE